MEISEVLERTEKEAEAEHIPILRGSERDLLRQAIEEEHPLRILEIGTAVGFSTVLMASWAPYTHIDTIEIDPERHHKACRMIEETGLGGRICCHLGDAAEIIPQCRGSYDFLFLDGPKGQYLSHLHLAEPLLSATAAVAADNVLFRGLVRAKGLVPHRYRTLVMRLREYMDYVTVHYDTVIYEDGDGLALSRRREKA